MLRTLIFDFDGLIIDTESALIDAYAAVHRRHSIPFDRDVFLRSVGHADYSFDPWHAFEKRADRAELELERRMVNKQLDRLLPLLPGVLSLIDAARESGLPLGVASNSRHPHVEGHLGRLGLRDRFAIISCRDDVPSPKPEPDVYRFALNQLGLPPHSAAAFEDSHTGALAAKRAGLYVVTVPNGSTAHHDFSPADWRVRSLTEVGLSALQDRVKGRGQRAEPGP
ncbi:MAG TPA: HAD-IA family hydrolase [Opitutaceae bacterium]